MPRTAQVDLPARVFQMHSLLAKYSTDFPAASWTSTTSTADDTSARCTLGGTIVITGTTGYFGSHILAQALEMPDVVRVYALNRQPSGNVIALRERQRIAFKKWRLTWDDRWLDDHRVVFQVADLAKPLMGLPQSLYHELQETVTVFIHNAWAVNFALPLSAYEPLLSGTRNLLDLALGSSIPGGPRVILVSSAGALWNQLPSVEIPETLDVDPRLAVKMGYSESKWVAEQLFGRVVEERGLRATIVRVTQLCGDSRTGSWNSAEMIPLFVRACQRLGCVATRDEDVLCTWVPVDIAATALLEMAALRESDELILHLISPLRPSWNELYGHVAVELDLPLVPTSVFLDRLWASADASGRESAHALKIAGVVEMYVTRTEVALSTEKTLQLSRTLSAVEPICREDVVRWLSFWTDIGFLTPSNARSKL